MMYSARVVIALTLQFGVSLTIQEAYGQYRPMSKWKGRWGEQAAD